MRNSFACSVFLRGRVTGREMTKAVAPKAICMNPKGLTHRTSPTTSGVERSPDESSLAKRGALRDNTRKKIVRKVIILFIYSLLSKIPSALPVKVYTF